MLCYNITLMIDAPVNRKIWSARTEFKPMRCAALENGTRIVLERRRIDTAALGLSMPRGKLRFQLSAGETEATARRVRRHLDADRNAGRAALRESHRRSDSA